ncbi:MAG: 2-keto-4-pentenoate hydratase, partial [Phenylobacterium zucineum]
MGERQRVLDGLADRLRRAETDVLAIPPIAAEDPELTIAEAYGVQVRNIRRKLEAGDRITGKKIGLTSAAMQDLLGVHQPDYGHLLASMDAASRVIDTAALVQPRIEAELAFVLASDLPTTGVTPDDVLAATGHVVASLEIVDSRIIDWRIGILDTVADNAS